MTLTTYAPIAIMELKRFQTELFDNLNLVRNRDEECVQLWTQSHGFCPLPNGVRAEFFERYE